MTSIMSLQTVEALITTVAHRGLEKLFPRLQLQTLDDGTTVYFLTGETKAKLHREPELMAIVLERILQPALREICGRNRVTSTKHGDIDFSNITEAVSLHNFLAQSAEAESLMGEFPNNLAALPLQQHAGIAKMLALLYADVVENAPGLALVGQFPTSLCTVPDSPQLPAAVAKPKMPRACRVDCVLGGSVIVSATAGTPATAAAPGAEGADDAEPGEKLVPCIAVRARELAKILAPHSSTAIDDKLPPQWRHKSFTLEEVEDILGAVAQSIVVQWSAGNKNDQSRTTVLALLRTVSAQLRDFLRDQLTLEASEIWRMPRASVARVAKVGRMWQRTSHLDVAKRLVGWEGALPRTTDDRFTEFVQRIDAVARIRLILERAAAVMGVAMSGAAIRGGVPSELMDVNPVTIFLGKSATDPSVTPMAEWTATVARWNAAFQENHRPRLTAKVAAAWKSLSDPQAIFSFVEENEELIIELLRTGTDAEQGNPELDPLIRALAKSVEEKIDESYRTVASAGGAAQQQTASGAIARMAAFRNSVAEIAPITAACSRVLERGPGGGEQVEAKLEEHLERARRGIHESLTTWCADTSKRLIAGLPVVVTVHMAQTDRDDITTAIFQCSFNEDMQHILEEAAELLGMTNTPFAVVPSAAAAAAAASSGSPTTPGARSSADAYQLVVPYEALQLSEEATRSFADIERVHRAFYRLRQQFVVFNTLTMRQIVPCTRPLFAAAIGKCVAAITDSPKGAPKLTFGPKSGAQLELVVQKLQSALEAAAQEWLAVRKLHTELGAMVNGLFDVDLVNAQEQWKNVLGDMRKAVGEYERVRNMVLPKERAKEIEALPTFRWKQHWDAQLYKALEHQYQRGLLVLNENTTDAVAVELRVKNGQVVFHPGYEKIRESYYQRIRDFVNIPNRFKGLANSDFFAEMPGRNGDAITQVHVRAMDLFARLGRVRKQFREHVLIGLCGFGGSWDLDALVQEAVTNHKAWEEGFKLVKERLRLAAKIDDSLKVDCIEINTAPVKAAIEDQLRRLEESLLASLRRASQRRLADIDSFVMGAANVVGKQPATLEELGESNRAMEGVRQRLPEMARMMDEQEQLVKLMRSVAAASGAGGGSGSGSGGSSSSGGGGGGNIVAMTADFSMTKSRWDHLQDAMSSHAKQMGGSVAKLRSNVEGMVNKFVRDLDRFMKSWNMHKPKDPNAYKTRQEFIDKCLAPAKDRAAEFEELRAAGKDMLEKCDFFGVSGPDMQAMTDAEEEVTSSMNQYKFFEELDAAVEQLGKEDWFTFRTRAHQFDDLLKSWSRRFKREVMNISEEASAAPLSESEVNKLIQAAQIAAAGGAPAAASGGGGGFHDDDDDHHNGGSTAATGPRNNRDGTPVIGVVAAYTARQILEWRSVFPMLRFVRGEGYQSEHWLEMFKLLEFDKGMTSDALRFRHFLEKAHRILLKEAELKALASRAGGEADIREDMQKLRTWSLDARFTLEPPPEGSTAQKVMLITGWKEVLTEVSDNQALLSSLSTSQWFARFEEEARTFEHRLLNVQEFAQLLMNAQRKWLYLEPLFSRGALPQEQARFKRVDREFVGILREIESDPRVMTLAQHDDYGDKLKAILDAIDRCQKALNDFLEQKRDRFPRFYFISDDDLLEILGQSKNPNVIQSHLKKLFAGIHRVIFNNPSEATAITHMVSSEGETVLLREPVPITDPNVEEWLIMLDRAMRGTLADLLVRATNLALGDMLKSMKIIDSFPSQILQAAAQVNFAKAMEQVLGAGGAGSGGDVSGVQQMLTAGLNALTALDYAEGITLAGTFGGDEAKFNEARTVRELKIKPLIMDVIHFLEIVDQVKSARGGEVRWYWQKQMRYYMEDYRVDRSKLSKAAEITEFEFNGKRAVVRMADTSFHYTYEYTGNAAKLVHTALTDVAYMTITKGAQLGFGTNLEGPAGTGKTESVKMLSNQLGRMTVVLNCDGELDSRSMTRVLTGVAKCGAWGCFDEFNRMKVDQLSAVSQIIQSIQEALKRGDPQCVVMGKTIDVHPATGIYVTMNPAGKKYGGRSKLPDNLKQLFRVVAMSVPDTTVIAETMLLSEGFQFAKEVAPRVVEVYRLSKQLLSAQQHYDWGLRPLKAVLRLGGSLVQQLRRAGETEPRTATIEGEFLVQSLRINTLSKLTFDDVKLFNGIISDVFPKVDPKPVDYEELEMALCAAARALGFEESPTQVAKALQLHEAMNQRMGVLLVGPPASGKSTLIKILRKAYESLGTRVDQYVMNPKAVERSVLLGKMDPVTRDWQSGILSDAARKLVAKPLTDKQWVYCDGDVDPEWIEALNSVLDDNKLLTLPTGVRIQFGSNVNFVFETHSLQYASPATVSRMGIIFLSEHDVQAHFLVKSFVQHRLNEKQRGLVAELMQTFILDAVDEVVDLDAEALCVPGTGRSTLINSCLLHTAGALNKFDFGSRLVRALCGFVNGAENKKKVAAAIFELVGEKPVAPSTEPLDAFFDVEKGKGRALKAADASDEVNLVQCAITGETPVIHTLEAMRTLATLEGLVNPAVPFPAGEGNCLTAFPPFFLVGPDGCGKSVMLQAIFDQLKAQAQKAVDDGAPQSSVAGILNIKVVTITCSAQTTASQVLQKLQQSCVQSTNAFGKVYRPKDAERLVLCLKNVNLPKPDKYGTVMLHSLLQQLLLYHGFYDGDLEWVGIDRVQIVGTMSTTGGRAPVTPRLLSLVNIVNVPHPDAKSMTGIFTALFRALLKQPAFKDGRQYDGGKELATLVTNVYGKVQKRFAGEEYKYCAFSPRDVTEWVLSLLRYDMGAASLHDVLAYEGMRIVTDRLPRLEDRGKAEKYLGDALRVIGASTQDVASKLYASWQCEWVSTSGAAAAAVAVAAAAPAADGAAKAAATATGGAAVGVPGGRGLKPIAIEQVKSLLEDGIVRYEREFGDLPLKLIPEMLHWTVRVDRAISRAGGHCALVGRAGMGRRTACIAAGYMIKCDIVRFFIGRDYGMKQFRNDLKAAIQKAATGEERVLLLVEDFNVINESFLEMINSLIAAGEVPGLFSNEETETMISALRDEMGADTTGFAGTGQQYLVRRVQRMLKVCLLMDPTHPMFGVRCQSNPAILSRCTVLWTDTFSSDGLSQLAALALQEVVGGIRAREDGKSKGFDAVYEVCKIHRGMIKDKDAPPEAFKALLRSFEDIFQSRAKASGDAVDRLEQGLSKLSDAEQQVADIRTRVTAQKAEAEKKKIEADEAMTDITKNMQDSAARKLRAEELTVKVKEKQAVIAEREARVNADLATIEPRLREAEEAVKGIKSENLSEIRGLRSPPPPIRDVLEAVLALLGIEDDSWAGMRKFLGERGVKDQILSFDAKAVPRATREKVAKLVEQHAENFKPEVIRRASAAAAPLAAWVTANLEHCLMLESAGPLRRELEELQADASKAQEKLDKYQKDVAKLEAKVAELNVKVEKKISESNDLEEQVAKAETQLAAAEQLFEKLSGEKDRWRAQSASIRADQAAMPRRALACASFMTYLGGESEDVRAATMKVWAERLKLDKDAAAAAAGGLGLFASFMRSESELLRYKSEGLPGDSLSIENAVAMLDAPRVPLVVDPAGQAQDWLFAHLKGKEGVNVEALSSGDDRFAHGLELAVRFGKTLLITDVDRIEPLLFNVLRRDLQSVGPKKVVQIGARQVDWKESFRLFLFCRAANDLRLPPDAAALVTLVNFSVTRLGLEAQLLGKTIQHEQPQLEVQKVDLLKREEALKLDLAKLEESLLRDLATSHGNLLENTALIASLNNIKSQAAIIHEGLEQSRALSEDLDQKRNVYRPLAAASSTLYFLFGDLVCLNRMYQVSLPSFLSLFEGALADGKKIAATVPVADKIQQLVQDMTRRSFFYVSRGLFKADRAAFAVHILNGLFPDQFPPALWNVLCGRGAGTAAGAPAFVGASPAEGGAGAASAFNGESPAESPLNPAGSPAGGFAGPVNVPAWATAGNPIEIKAGLRRAAAAIPDYETRWKLGDDAGWRAWMQSPKPFADVFARVPTLCDAFLFMSIFLRAEMQQSMAHAARQRLQISDLALVESVEQLVEKTTAAVPTLLITSSGADPSIELETAAFKIVGRERVERIALGGGQTEEALTQLRACAQQGKWLILKNVHLVLDWAQATLEKELGALANAHEEFRLWLTTEPHDQFPTVLLRSSLKMTFESPPGVRSNVLRTLTTLPVPPANATPLGGSLVFALTWFHALLSERRTYIPQGWTKMYEFTLADARAAADVLYALSSSGSVDWAFVRGMLNQAIYGGRLDAQQDMRVLEVFLGRIFKDATVVAKSEPLFRQLSVPASLAAAPKEVLERLPDVDPPAVFNLPDNADIVVHEIAAANSLSQLKMLGQGVQLSGRLSADAVKAMIAPVINQFWRTAGGAGSNASPASPADGAGAAAGGGVPNPADTPLGEVPRVPQIGELSNSPSRGSFRRSSSLRANSTLGLSQGALPDPLEVFLCSEIALIAALMGDVHALMAKACEVVSGDALAGPELVAAAPALASFTTPDKWLDRMPGPENLQQWVALLRLRAKRALDWHQKFAGSKTLLNEKLDLADLVRPQTFLNALRQHTARRTGNELVRLVLNSSTTQGATLSQSGRTVAVTLSGASLSIQGGVVGAGGRLASVAKAAASTAPFVDLALAWVLDSDVPQGMQTQSVKVPLYSDSSRETLVADVYLTCEPNTADDWVLRGTALILVPPMVAA